VCLPLGQSLEETWSVDTIFFVSKLPLALSAISDKVVQRHIGAPILSLLAERCGNAAFV